MAGGGPRVRCPGADKGACAPWVITTPAPPHPLAMLPTNRWATPPVLSALQSRVCGIWLPVDSREAAGTSSSAWIPVAAPWRVRELN